MIPNKFRAIVNRRMAVMEISVKSLGVCLGFGDRAKLDGVAVDLDDCGRPRIRLLLQCDELDETLKGEIVPEVMAKYEKVENVPGAVRLVGFNVLTNLEGEEGADET